eukprot:526971-Rhodomonas_salina.4
MMVPPDLRAFKQVRCQLSYCATLIVFLLLLSGGSRLPSRGRDGLCQHHRRHYPPAISLPLWYAGTRAVQENEGAPNKNIGEAFLMAWRLPGTLSSYYPT